MSRSSSLTVLLSLAGLAACAAPAPDVAAVRTGIDAVWSAFEAAHLAGKGSAVATEFFSADAINSVPDAPDARGRAAIDTQFTAAYAAMKVTAVTHTTQDLDVAGDLAFERGTFVQTIVPGTAAPQVQHARYFAVWKRQADGKWKCYRFLFNVGPA
jgi:ketosteroid isomerase-like protein